MNAEQYTDEVKKRKEQHLNDLKALAIKYAFENNPYKKGDIVEDHVGKIEIDHIYVYIPGFETSLPSCIYEGFILNKDNTINKRKKRRSVYQMNINYKSSPLKPHLS